jgi:hypothetical protein
MLIAIFQRTNLLFCFGGVDKSVDKGREETIISFRNLGVLLMCQEQFTTDAKVEEAKKKLREHQDRFLSCAKEALADREYDPSTLRCVGIEEFVLVGPDTYRKVCVIITESFFMKFVVWVSQALGKTLRGEVFSLEKPCGDMTVTLHVYAY